MLHGYVALGGAEDEDIVHNVGQGQVDQYRVTLGKQVLLAGCR